MPRWIGGDDDPGDDDRSVRAVPSALAGNRDAAGDGGVVVTLRILSLGGGATAKPRPTRETTT